MAKNYTIRSLVMIIKIKKLTETAQMPKKNFASDAAFDLYLDAPDALYHEWNGGVEIKAARGIKIRTHATVMLHRGIATEIRFGYYMEIYATTDLY